jgi:hypothetical protein
LTIDTKIGLALKKLITLDIIGDYFSFPQTKSEEPNDQEVVLRRSQWFGFSQSQEANG